LTGAILGALLLLALPLRAEYCVNYSAGVLSLARQAGSYQTRGCVATEAQCNAGRMSRPGDYSGGCYYVPGMYPPTPGKSGGGAASDQGAKSSAEAQKKIRAQQQAEDEAAQRAAQQARQDLLGGLKGVEPSSTGLTIKLPAAPAPAPTGGAARAQLNCVARASAASAREDAARLGPGAPVRGAQDDFENAEDCRPLNPAAPPVPAPTPVAADGIPTDRAQLAQFLQDLLARMASSRQHISGLDQDIARLEAQVAREEQQAPKVDVKTAPAGESDALRKAREALAKARADRQKAAAEYEKLQQQEQAARQRQAAP
jgi:hypothetical protein